MVSGFFDGYFLFTITAVACFGSLAVIVIENKVAGNANLMHPMIPVLWNRSGLFQIQIPRVCFPTMALLQFFCANLQLEFNQSGITALLGFQIILDHRMVFRADPFVHRILYVSGPRQHIQLGIAPFLFYAVVGDETHIFLIQIQFKCRQFSSCLHWLSQEKRYFQNIPLHQASKVHTNTIPSAVKIVITISVLQFVLFCGSHHRRCCFLLSELK